MRSHSILFLLIFFLFFLMLSSPSSANAEGIFIAGTTLELGMSIEKLKQNISDNYELKIVDEQENNYFIITKDGPPYQILGNLGFENNKLTYISKDWGNYKSKDSVKLIENLFVLINSVNKGETNAAFIGLSETAREPNLKSDSLKITFDTYTIKITKYKSDKYGDQVGISQILKK